MKNMRNTYTFKVTFDPDPTADEWVSISGLLIGIYDLFYGLKFKSFEPGTVIQDVSTSTFHTVTINNANDLVLIPNSTRLDQHNQSKVAFQCRKREARKRYNDHHKDHRRQIYKDLSVS